MTDFYEYITKITNEETFPDHIVIGDPILFGSSMGYDVSLSGDGSTAFIGAIGADGTGNPWPALQSYSPGAVYIYYLVDGVWEYQDKLSPSDTLSDWTIFGFTVASSYDGNTVIVSGYMDGSANSGEEIPPPEVWEGQVWMFHRSWVGDVATWTEEGQFAREELGDLSLLGWELDMVPDGSLALATNPTVGFNYGVGGVASGAVYIYSRSAGIWTEDAKIQTIDLDTTFGASALFINPNKIVIGATSAGGTNGASRKIGAVYTAINDGGWSVLEDKTVEPSAGWGNGIGIAANERFLAISGFAYSPYGGVNSILIYENDGDNGWTYSDEIFPSSEVPNTEASYTMALTINNYLVVGSGYTDTDPSVGFPATRGGRSKIAVWKYSSGSWIVIQSGFTPPDVTTGSGLVGSPIGVSKYGERLLIAQDEDDGERGAAWIYDGTPSAVSIALRIPIASS